MQRAQDVQREARGSQWHLVDFKTITPEVFKAGANQSYNIWSKKIKAFCNAKLDGFRIALGWAERTSEPITIEAIQGSDWAPCEVANGRLYDILVMFCANDPLAIVENYVGQGFEAWRNLARRYDPVGDIFTFDAMSSLMSRPRWRHIGELAITIERWYRDVLRYQSKTGGTLPDKWKLPIIFQMVPRKNDGEIKSRWQLSDDKDVNQFATDLIAYCSELKYEEGGHKDPDAMDISALQREADAALERSWYRDNGYDADYTSGENRGEEDWEAQVAKIRADAEAHISWLGNGAGGRKGKGKGNGGLVSASFQGCEVSSCFRNRL